MTGETIGEVLAFGVGVALSPLAIVAAVVLLVSPRGARPAWLYLAGWLATLTVVTTVVVLIADEADASADGGPASWVSIVKIVVAVLLVGFGVAQWRSHGDGETEPDAPGWMRKLDDVTATKAAGLGNMINAVMTARRGAASAADVVNTRPLEAILARRNASRG